MHSDSLQKDVLKLDLKWFHSKQKFFTKEVFYSKTRNKIVEIIKGTGETFDYVNNQFVPDDDITIELDFLDYCWSDLFPNSKREMAHENEDDINLPVNSESIAIRISQWISETINGVIDNSAKHNVILSVIDAIKETIEVLVKGNEDNGEYIAVLDDFLTRFRQKITKKFHQIKKVHLISTEYRQRLLFNLNQEELGALLYILYNAEIFHTSTPGDTSFLNFCEDLFYFRNQKQDGFTKATRIRNKFNDAKNSSVPAINKIVNKLKQSFLHL